MSDKKLTEPVPCPKCHSGMIYVTSIPRHSLQRTTFVCYVCRQTRSYMLPSEMAEAYAEIAASASVANAS